MIAKSNNIETLKYLRKQNKHDTKGESIEELKNKSTIEVEIEENEESYDSDEKENYWFSKLSCPPLCKSSKHIAIYKSR